MCADGKADQDDVPVARGGEVMRAEATWMAAEDEFGAISMIYDSRLRSDTAGELITDEEAFERFPEEFGPTGDGMPPGMTRIYLATSPARYPSFVARESGVLMLVAVLATGAALAAVYLRRPGVAKGGYPSEGTNEGTAPTR